MTRVIVNLLVCVGMVLGLVSFICSFRVMFQAKDSGHSLYGGALMFRPDLLTPKGRRLCGLAWFCFAAFLFIWFTAFCLAHTSAMSKQ